MPRSLSYYAPRIVEDSGAVDSPKPTFYSPPSSLPPISPISPLSSPSSTVRSLRSMQTDSNSSLPRPVASRGQTRGLSRRPSSEMSSPLSPLSSPREQRRDKSQDSSVRTRPRRPLLTPYQLVRTATSETLSKSRWRNKSDTPPEDEPRGHREASPSTSRHYFRTFSNDMMRHGVGVSALQTPATVEDINFGDFYGNERSPQHSERSPTESSSPMRHKNRKLSGVFHSLRESRSAGATPSTGTPSSISTGKPTIKLFSPGLAKSRRLSSIGSYFAHARGGTRSHALSPSPNEVSPLSTHWEDVLSESQDPARVRDISEPMSPLSGPVQSLRPSFIWSEATFGPRLRADPPIPKMASAVSLLSAETDQIYQAAHNQGSQAGPNETINFLPSEMKRVATPPLRQKPSGFKTFFFDKKSIPESRDEDSPGPATTKRRKALVTVASLQSLVHKVSLPKVRLKRSYGVSIQDTAPHDAQRSRTEVNAFYQTPYSQRYSDARRAKIAQIRSYMNEAMREDDSGADSSTMGTPFELNVPDHLPNSPLCPLSAKHKGGGKAICPMHRRLKTGLGTGDGGGGARGGRGGSEIGRKVKERVGAPVIVFESSQKDGSGRHRIQ